MSITSESLPWTHAKLFGLSMLNLLGLDVKIIISEVSFNCLNSEVICFDNISLGSYCFCSVIYVKGFL